MSFVHSDTEQPSLQLPTVLASMYPTYIRDPGTAWSQFPHVQPRPQMDPRTFVLWTPSPFKHGSSQPLAATHSPLSPTWDFSLPPHNYQSSNLVIYSQFKLFFEFLITVHAYFRYLVIPDRSTTVRRIMGSPVVIHITIPVKSISRDVM